MINPITEPLEELEKDLKIFEDTVECLEKRYDVISQEIIHRLIMQYINPIASEINHKKRGARLQRL